MAKMNCYKARVKIQDDKTTDDILNVVHVIVQAEDMYQAVRNLNVHFGTDDNPDPCFFIEVNYSMINIIAEV